MTQAWKRYAWVILATYLVIGFFIWPVLGIIALVCMLAPVVTALFKGRTWCGWYCPRGSLWDRVLTRVNPGKRVPGWAKSIYMRIFMLAVIITVFSVQMVYAWPDLQAIGLVFLRIIFITTLVGIVLAIIYSPRTWCNFCPMGTLASWVTRAADSHNIMTVDSNCVQCKKCAKVCPMQLKPYRAKGQQFSDPDCIKCGACAKACPKHSISFSQNVGRKQSQCPFTKSE